MFLETKEAGEVQQAPAKTMKLSEAIRIGCAMHPQGRGAFFDGFGTCALGAAAEARGWQPSTYAQGMIEKFIPDVDKVHWIGRIASMNDDEGMTREAIADWLEAQGH